MTEQDIKDLYKHIQSLYGLKYKTRVAVYKNCVEISYDHMGPMEHRSRILDEFKDVIKTIDRYNVMDVIIDIANGRASLVTSSDGESSIGQIKCTKAISNESNIPMPKEYTKKSYYEFMRE